ncbi:MAG: hypothetical protein GVY14_07005 [Spirochaetes bacterium]|nr:hypothetical protein [Spirochaetota bacterium]
MNRKARLIQFGFLLVFVVISSQSVRGADILVPRFELLTRGYPSGGSLLLATRADIDLAVEGGYKFGGGVGFSISDPVLEDSRDTGLASPADVEAELERYLALTYAEATVRSLFDAPLSMTYFVGTTDTFASGDDFPELFGTGQFATFYRGALYSYDSTIYDGLYEVAGTGVEFATDPLGDAVALSAYTYQDLRFEPGVYSSDVRARFNTRQVKAELFAGATYPIAEGGLYRGGVMAFFDTGTAGQFFAQLGLPQWDPWSGDQITLDDFYFLFEPRVKLDLFSVILTLFWRPEYYNHALTGDTGALDSNIRFQIGDYQKTRVRGGIETGLHYRPEADENLEVDASPFISVTTAGVVWDFMIRATLYPYEYEESFEGYLGIRTAF